MKWMLYAFIFFISGCAVIQSVSLSNVDLTRQQDKKVQVSYNLIGILHLAPFLFYEDIDQISQLKKKCPEGQITNIQTTVVMTTLLFAQSYELYSTANCSEK